MPTYFFLVLAYGFPVALEPVPPSSHTIFISLIFIITFLLPAMSLGILKTLGVIRSFEMESRQERVIPFLMTSLVYVTITLMFYFRSRIGLEDNFLRLMVIIDALAIAATLITLIFKVSIHSMTAWGITGMLLMLNKSSELNSLFYPALICIVITGLIMSARLQLQSHSFREVMWGGVFGLLTSTVGMIILF